MLRTLLVSVSALALMSGAAFAKPGNDSTINQTFDANVATVDQASSSWGSTSTIDQAGVSNTA